MSRLNATDQRVRLAAVATVALVIAVTAVAFLKHTALRPGYEVRAVLSSSNQLKKGSDVRTAGVKVGRVRAIAVRSDGTAVVTMRIADAGRPVRTDSELRVRPRLLLEGNGYLELRPGSPAAPELKSGGVLPATQTAVAVQADEALGTLDAPTRAALHSTIGVLSGGLGTSGARPRAIPGARGLKRTVRALDEGLERLEDVARSLRGTRPGDLGRAVRSVAAATSQIGADPRALQGLVTSTARVTSALAADERALAASVRGLASTLRAAPPALVRIDRAMPRLATFARAVRPALRAAPDSLRGLDALFEELSATVRPRELPAVLNGLRPAVRALPGFERDLRTLFALLKPSTDCVSSHIVPTLNMKIADGPHSTGDPVWLDFMHAFTGLTGVTSSFDANGGAIRLGVAVGEQNLTPIVPGLGKVATRFGGAAGLNPAWLGSGVIPPYRPDAACAEQALPDLGARSAPAPSWATGGRRR